MCVFDIGAPNNLLPIELPQYYICDDLVNTFNHFCFNVNNFSTFDTRIRCQCSILTSVSLCLRRRLQDMNFVSFRIPDLQGTVIFTMKFLIFIKPIPCSVLIISRFYVLVLV